MAINTTTEGGQVTYVTAPTSSEQSFIKRVMPLTQTTDVPTEGTIPEDSLNNEYDRSRMIDIQQQEEIDRTIKFVETSDLSDVTLPEGTSAANRASKVIAYDSAGTGLELVSTQTGTNVDPIAVQGDIAQGGVTGAAEKLAIGATGSMLSVVVGKWATFAAGATSAVQQIVAGVPAWVTNPILLLPTIADFTNANHTHESAAQGGFANGVVQAVNKTSGAMGAELGTTSTVVMVLDDTIPQNTEGAEYLTLSITPKDAANILKIDIVLMIASTAITSYIMALFQDSTVNALAAISHQKNNTNAHSVLTMSHWMTAGTTSSTTFKVRANGSAAATYTVNGVGGVRDFGGVASSSITITEIQQ